VLTESPGNKPRRRQPGPGCRQPGQLGCREGLSWREKRTLRPKRQEAASRVTLPARVRPAEPRQTWWTQPASPTLQTRGAAVHAAAPTRQREGQKRGGQAGGRRATSSRHQEGECGTQDAAGGRDRFQLKGDAKAPAPDQLPGGSDEFARELVSTMSTIASLVIKASGRSVSNGGWLYFNGESEDYCAFRAKCRLFQETYHKATPPVALVKMFRVWNLAEMWPAASREQRTCQRHGGRWTRFTAPCSR
jgi:hypothetical protein